MATSNTGGINNVNDASHCLTTKTPEPDAVTISESIKSVSREPTLAVSKNPVGNEPIVDAVKDDPESVKSAACESNLSASPDGHLNCRPASTATASTPTGGANDSEYESVDEGDNESSSESHKLVEDNKSPEQPDPASSPPSGPDAPPAAPADDKPQEPSIEIVVAEPVKKVDEPVPVAVKSDPLPIPGKSAAEVKREGSVSPSKGKTSRKFDASWADENAEIAMPGELDELNPLEDAEPRVPTPVPEAIPQEQSDIVKVGQEPDETDDVVDVDGNDEEPPSYEEEDDYEEAASRSDRGSDLRSRSRSPFSGSDRSRDQSIGSQSVSGSEEEEEDVSNNAEDGKAEEKPLDDDEDRKNPQYIPKRGAFYEHDDRLGPEDEVAVSAVDGTEAVAVVDGQEDVEQVDIRKEMVVKEPEKVLEIKSRALAKDASPATKDSSKDISSPKDSSSKKGSTRRRESTEVDRWGHDMFQEDEQKPKSKDELVTSYGYDIRNEDNAPKARRRRKYARGPVKYTRNWEDQDAYTGRNDGNSRGGKGRDDRRRSKDAPSSADGSKISDDNVVAVQSVTTASPATSIDTRSPLTSSGQQAKSSGSKSRAMDKIALREAHREEERKKYQRDLEEKDAMAKSYARRTNSGNKKLFEDRDREPQQPRPYRDGGSNRDNRNRDSRGSGPRRDQRDFRNDNRVDRRDDQFQRPQQPRNRNRSSFHDEDFPELAPTSAPKGNIVVTIRNNNNNSSSTSNGSPRAWSGEAPATRSEPMKVIEALESKLEQQQLQQQNRDRREPIRSLTFSNSNYSKNRRNDGDGGDQRRSGYREERTRSDGDRRPPSNRRMDERDRRGNSFNQRRGDGRAGGGFERRDQDRRNDRGPGRRQLNSHEHDDRFDGDQRLDEVNSNMSRLSLENVNNNKSKNNVQQYREVTLDTDPRPKRYSALRQQQQQQHQSSRSMSPSDDVSLASTTSSSRHNLHHDPSQQQQQHLLAAVVAQQQHQGHSQPSPPVHHSSHQSQQQYYDHQIQDSLHRPQPDQHPGNFYDQSGHSVVQQQPIPGQFSFPDPSTGQFLPHPMVHPNQGRFLPDPAHMPRSSFQPGPPGIPPPPAPQSASGPLPVIPGPGPSFLPSFPPSGYPQYPPPAAAPPSATYHQTMVAPTAVPSGVPVQGTGGPSTGPSGPELYRGGVTYYDTSQQQAVMRSLPPKRPKNIIPIVPPPDGRGNPGSDGHNSQMAANDSGY